MQCSPGRNQTKNPGRCRGFTFDPFDIGSVFRDDRTALPLFATGLGALGLFGWRRKRKNAAIAAA